MPDLLTDEAPALHRVCMTIRAGWLPHRLSNGSWWYGRPAGTYGFRMWSTGSVPTMSVVIPMPPDEAEAWVSTLHPMAAERTA